MFSSPATRGQTCLSRANTKRRATGAMRTQFFTLLLAVLRLSTMAAAVADSEWVLCDGALTRNELQQQPAVRGRAAFERARLAAKPISMEYQYVGSVRCRGVLLDIERRRGDDRRPEPTSMDGLPTRAHDASGALGAAWREPGVEGEARWIPRLHRHG
ncbi:unnamed protein product, partial [Ectocarpus sp. 6 AP-2014]